MKTPVTVVVSVLIPVFVASIGCSLLGSGVNAPGLPPDASSAQVTADEVLQGLTAAWNAAVPVCLAAQDAGALKAGSCEDALLPAHDGLLAAASAIDAWNAGTSGAFACSVADVVHGLVSVEALLQDAKVSVPPAVQDGLLLAEGFQGFCQHDAGYVGGQPIAPVGD